MAYDLDGMTLATEGHTALTEDDDYAIQPFALLTIGVVVCPLVDEAVQPNAGGEPMVSGEVRRENEKRFLMVAYAFMRLREWH